MKNQNVTEGEKAEFFCEAEPDTEPSPKIEFMINALPLDGKLKIIEGIILNSVMHTPRYISSIL